LNNDSHCLKCNSMTLHSMSKFILQNLKVVELAIQGFMMAMSPWLEVLELSGIHGVAIPILTMSSRNLGHFAKCGSLAFLAPFFLKMWVVITKIRIAKIGIAKIGIAKIGIPIGMDR
jgi:hypothetical protein